ncbi:hypothetical protein [Helicobacter sp.]|uniref:hypothetical protein n=1 Tax=Helicobacter sp. TaxID=218 RepID=UPI0019AAC723|nr:hypothetical protein [Helicobacter sp.]MBD5166141.1 hypothetical protein [Helicobacter sp.]
MKRQISLDRESFMRSLNQEQQELVKQVDALYSDFVDLQIAKMRLQEWEAKGKPRGYTLDEARKEILGIECS